MITKQKYKTITEEQSERRLEFGNDSENVMIAWIYGKFRHAFGHNLIISNHDL